MSLDLRTPTGSPDFMDVGHGGDLILPAWAEGLSPAQVMAAANEPFTFNRTGSFVPLSTVPWIERFLLEHRGLVTVALVVLALLLVLGFMGGR